ncbi:MAG: cell division protein FtsZ [Chloroflexota bacterium]
MAKTSYITSSARIKAIGVGGGGCNAITRMVRDGITGVEFIAMNTDGQALALSEVSTKLQLGEKACRGLGAGGDHLIGARAAEESAPEIKKLVEGADMVFVTAGMGGGTGTGGIPTVAEVAKASGALTIGIVTKPFGFEGIRRSKVAEAGLLRLAEKVDSLIIVSNDRLLELCDAKTSVDAAFKMADDVLKGGVSAIAEVITVPGLINLDFADIRAIMGQAGPAWMSIGRATGPNRAVEAAKSALSSRLLDVSVSGAKGVLMNITGGSTLTLRECQAAATAVGEAVSPDANIIFGVVLDANMDTEVQITIVATGFAPAYGTKPPTAAELRSLLHGVDDTTLDVPTFLRRSPSMLPSFGQTSHSTPQPAPSEANETLHSAN